MSKTEAFRIWLHEFFQNFFGLGLGAFLAISLLGMLCIPFFLRQIRGDVDRLERRSKKMAETLQQIERHLAAMRGLTEDPAQRGPENPT